MIKIGEFFIKNQSLLIALIFIFLIFGIFSYFNLNRKEDPDFKIRTASITTIANGFSPIEVDKYITSQIEKSIFQMDEIENIRSESFFNKSVIYVDLFENQNNIQQVWDKLRRKTELSISKLPNGIKPVVNDEFDTVFGALVSISNENVNYETLFDTTNNIKNDFLKLSQRGKVEIFGANKEVIYLKYKNAYFSSLGFSVNQILDFFSLLNVLDGGGDIFSKNNLIKFNLNSPLKSFDDIKKVQIPINNNSVLLDSIFKIEKTTDIYNKTLIRANGNNSLLIGISLKKNGNILKWGAEIKELIKKVQKKYKGYKIESLILQSDYAKTLTDKFSNSLFESIFFVILITILILNKKVGFIVGFIILLTISSTFLVMNLFNVSLDKITLSALIISLGILVDNSVVIAEAILNNQKKLDKKELILAISSKFQFPLFVTTLIASFSFLPIFISKSTVSEYASNLFVIIFIVLFFSWFYSITVLPFLILKFFSFERYIKRNFLFLNYFKRLIENSFLHSKKVVLISLILFLFSLILFLFIPKIFFPDSDRNMFEIRLNLNNGAAFNQTKETIIKIENYLKTLADVKKYASFIGMSAPRYVLSANLEAERENLGMLLVILNNYKTVDKNILKVKDFISKHILNAQVIVRKTPLGPPVDAPFEIRIYDNNLDKLFSFYKKVKNELLKIDGISLIKDNWGEKILEYQIDLNQNQLVLSNVSSKELYDFLNSFYNGKNLGFYYRDDIKIPIILIGDNSSYNPEFIQFLTLSNKNNSIIPINQLANIYPKFVYPKIIRRNNFYSITLQTWLNDVGPFEVKNKILPKLNSIEGLNFEFGGVIEKSKKGNISVIKNIPICYGLIFLVLIYFFKSFLIPSLILFSSFLSIIGANFGLFLLGKEFGFITLLGYICLVGICTNNGVILFSEISSYEENEIINAVKKRVEPVFLTCFTTILGMLPLWLKNDSMFSTLAVSIVFGLLSSFFITLFFLPNLYCLIIKSKLFNRN